MMKKWMRGLIVQTGRGGGTNDTKFGKKKREGRRQGTLAVTRKTPIEVPGVYVARERSRIALRQRFISEIGTERRKMKQKTSWVPLNGRVEKPRNAQTADGSGIMQRRSEQSWHEYDKTNRDNGQATRRSYREARAKA